MATLESFGCLRANDHDLITFNMGKHCIVATNSMCVLVIVKNKFLKWGEIMRKVYQS